MVKEGFSNLYPIKPTAEFLEEQSPSETPWLSQVLKATMNGVSPVAVKVLKDASGPSREAFWREMALLMSLRHSNIVQFQVSPAICTLPSLSTDMTLPQTALIYKMLEAAPAFKRNSTSDSCTHIVRHFYGLLCRVITDLNLVDMTQSTVASQSS